MNSTFWKIAIAYIAGIGTYLLFHSFAIKTKVDQIDMHVMSLNTSPDSTAGTLCPCDNSTRYNVDPKEESLNMPTTETACKTMVSSANPDVRGVTITGKGAWFSKVTLDNMFCHKMDANGIYVYKAKTAEGTDTYVVEAARSNKINSTDDGTSYIYYSRSMCPTVCGVCGM